MIPPKCGCGCGRSTKVVDKTRGEYKKGTYRKYYSHQCYLSFISQNKKTVCDHGHQYRVVKGRKKCATCNAQRQFSKKTGISLERIRAFRQPTACEICSYEPSNEPWQGLVLDHDHTTNELRGWLCFNCNVSLGKFKDDPKLLKAAISYLVKGNHWGDTKELTEGQVYDFKPEYKGE